ncbi:hypothetical protein AB0B50_19895 [Streptomyces sp. NPDC041068]|uniref:hypothetical protein n=1 Tax=Streptomyces sp. NPDC041068 TaxID=3155130 RepID=UPI00340C7749
MSNTQWATDQLHVSYCQYYLWGDDLLDAHDDTATATAIVRRIFDGNSLAAHGNWEAVVDVSIDSTSGSLWLTKWGGSAAFDAGNFATAGPGWYRVRVQPRGRDAGEDPPTVTS